MQALQYVVECELLKCDPERWLKMAEIFGDLDDEEACFGRLYKGLYDSWVLNMNLPLREHDDLHDDDRVGRARL